MVAAVLRHADFVDVLVVKRNLSLITLIKACNAIEKGRLARAGIAGQGIDFALLKLDVCAIANKAVTITVRMDLTADEFVLYMVAIFTGIFLSFILLNVKHLHSFHKLYHKALLYPLHYVKISK